MVLPEPGEPARRIMLPLGKPPSIMSSRPFMPVGILVSGFVIVIGVVVSVFSIIGVHL